MVGGQALNDPVIHWEKPGGNSDGFCGVINISTNYRRLSVLSEDFGAAQSGARERARVSQSGGTVWGGELAVVAD